MYLAQLAFVLRSSFYLVHLTLDDFPVNGNNDLDFLCATIAGLTRLQSLELNLTCPEREQDDHLISTVLLSCSQDVGLLKVKSRSVHDNSFPATSIIKPSGKSPRTNKEPLDQLTVWKFYSTRGYSVETIYVMIDHCPNLVEMEMPHVRGEKEDWWRVGWYVGEHCLGLQRLTTHFKTSADRDCNGELMAAILSRLAENTAKSIFFECFRVEDLSLSVSLLIHFGSITSVEFHECRRFDGRDIVSILNECLVLEVFTVTGKNTDNMAVRLKDLLACDWTSEVLRSLQLPVVFKDMKEIKAMRGGREKVITKVQKKSKQKLERLQLDVCLETRGGGWDDPEGPGFSFGGEIGQPDAEPLTFYTY
ncbi:hypothetical protein BGX29_001484 [Mortierella sp. GBA35]|nr:hypothetical protein BGX29_001484 [Mortierella sp. GBA35]